LANGRQANELFGVLDGEIAEQKSVDEGEDSGVCADAEGEREDGGRGEGGALSEDAEGVAEGLEQTKNRIPPFRTVALLEL
jgi:hypothetical protein